MGDSVLSVEQVTLNDTKGDFAGMAHRLHSFAKRIECCRGQA